MKLTKKQKKKMMKVGKIVGMTTFNPASIGFQLWIKCYTKPKLKKLKI